MVMDAWNSSTYEARTKEEEEEEEKAEAQAGIFLLIQN